jgi:mitochondrial fission 1 protein
MNYFKEVWTSINKNYKNEDEKLILRDCIYYISLGHYELGEFQNAKKMIEILLIQEPENTQAKSLLENIETKLKNDGLLGIGLIGVAGIL